MRAATVVIDFSITPWPNFDPPLKGGLDRLPVSHVVSRAARGLPDPLEVEPRPGRGGVEPLEVGLERPARAGAGVGGRAEAGVGAVPEVGRVGGRRGHVGVQLKGRRQGGGVAVLAGLCKHATIRVRKMHVLRVSPGLTSFPAIQILGGLQEGQKVAHVFGFGGGGRGLKRRVKNVFSRSVSRICTDGAGVEGGGGVRR